MISAPGTRAFASSILLRATSSATSAGSVPPRVSSNARFGEFSSRFSDKTRNASPDAASSRRRLPVSHARTSSFLIEPSIRFAPLSIMAAHSHARGGRHSRSLALPVVVLMLMKEPGDLLLQQRNLAWFDAANGMLEELPLNMGGQIVPLQEHRCPKALQDMRLLLGQRCTSIAISSCRPKGTSLSLPPGKGTGARTACTTAFSSFGCHVFGHSCAVRDRHPGAGGYDHRRKTDRLWRTLVSTY